jgi:hypothetical protein
MQSNKKKRHRPIFLAEHRKIMKILIQMAKAMGVKVEIRNKPVSFPRHGRPKRGTVCGLYHFYNQRKIVITKRGRPSRRNLLGVLAHEVRHAIHQHIGIFSNYYACEPLPDLRIAIRAERDCDKWAINFLKKFNIIYDPGIYPLHDTAAYMVHSTHLRTNPRSYHISLRKKRKIDKNFPSVTRP